MKVYDNATKAIGNTPLVRAVNLEKNQNTLGKIFIKIEGVNPAGSIKDRVALSMINDAEERGVIKSGATIIEPTSGNTGIGIAYICAKRGYKAILVMPDTMSRERIDLLLSYGAEVVLTDGALGMQGSIDKANLLSKEIQNSVILGQFKNPANPKAHYENTGVEIYNDTNGKVDVLVAGIGTGGTISGTGKYLKEKTTNVEIVGVEPFDSPLITKGYSGKHGIQGIGANFIPKNLDLSVVDKVLTATTEESFAFSKLLAKTENVYAGISSGAALSVAIRLAKEKEYKDKNIVVILPDTGDRYASVKLFD